MFNLKEYRKSYYQLHRKESLEKARLMYIEKGDVIKEKRRISRENETEEHRIKRLSYLKKYHKKNSQKSKEKNQTNESKFRQYVSSANRRDYEFSLSFDEFKEVFHGKCEYCGKPDSRGIDRVENSIGYTKENSVPCCEMCNKMKWKYSKDEFLKQIMKIHNKLVS